MNGIQNRAGRPRISKLLTKIQTKSISAQDEAAKSTVFKKYGWYNRTADITSQISDSN